MTGTEFRSAYHDHKDAVYHFAWRMTSSPEASEDIVQEVFLSLLRRPGHFDCTKGPLRPFLLGAARNLVLKRWRVENRWNVLEEDQFIAQPVDVTQGETARIVEAAVGSLPPLQREVLLLAEYEELSLEQIARTVEAEVGTVKARLYRARENLRRMLAPLKKTNGRSLTSYGTTK
jgi:RNA polymerase sigma-70 factor (ECF subfamily)